MCGTSHNLEELQREGCQSIEWAPPVRFSETRQSSSTPGWMRPDPRSQVERGHEGQRDPGADRDEPEHLALTRRERRRASIEHALCLPHPDGCLRPHPNICTCFQDRITRPFRA